MDLQIAVDARDVTGKHTKRLRNAGIVPGVLFGKKAGSIPVQLDAKVFEAIYREAGRTTIVKVSVAGGSPTNAVIKNVQRNPLTGRALHVDFFAPDMTSEMIADIQVVYTGTAPGVEASGGYLLTSLDRLRVRALPSDLPHEITVDVSPLVDLESAIHVRDLQVTGNVTVLTDPDEMVARVEPPRVEVEEEPAAELAEGEAAEGAEGEAAEGAEGEAAPGGEGGGTSAEASERE
jgi:large subunit ribosomal protein L25